MATINALCAPPNGRNPGMASVDLALASLLEDVDASVTYWRLWDPAEWLEPVAGTEITPDGSFTDETTGITYRSLRGHLDEFLASDAVLYWGDFLHMAVYLEQNHDVLSRRMGLPEAESSGAFAARHLLLTDQPADVLGRVATFGTTLMFNTFGDYRSPYGAQLAHFLGGVRRAWFRDPYSAHVAQLYRPEPADNCKGVDAAMLLPASSTPVAKRDTVGVFLGRSHLSPEWAGAFGRRLCDALDAAPEWIEWGQEPTFWPVASRRRFRIAWPALEHHATQLPLRTRLATVAAAVRGDAPARQCPSLDELFDQIRSCAVVVTDTYHLAVNAWRLGTPAVCLVDAPTAAWNVNAGEGSAARDKRRDLYSQLDAVPLVVDMGAGAAGEARRVADVLARGEVAEAALERQALAAGRARRDVLREFESLLAR